MNSRVIAAVAALVLVFEFGAFDAGKASIVKVVPPMDGSLAPSAKNILVNYGDPNRQRNLFSIKGVSWPAIVNETIGRSRDIDQSTIRSGDCRDIETSIHFVREAGKAKIGRWKMKSISRTAAQKELCLCDYRLAAASVVDIKSYNDRISSGSRNVTMQPANGNPGAVARDKFPVPQIDACSSQPSLFGSGPRGILSFDPQEDGRGCQDKREQHPNNGTESLKGVSVSINNVDPAGQVQLDPSNAHDEEAGIFFIKGLVGLVLLAVLYALLERWCRRNQI